MAPTPQRLERLKCDSLAVSFLLSYLCTGSAFACHGSRPRVYRALSHRLTGVRRLAVGAQHGGRRVWLRARLCRTLPRRVFCARRFARVCAAANRGAAAGWRVAHNVAK